MKIDKTYLYSGAAILAAFGFYLYMRKKATQNNQETTPEEQNVIDTYVTPSGAEVTVEQSIVDLGIEKAIKDGNAVATVKLRNAPLYSKIDNVAIRYQNYVNDGFVSNKAGNVPLKGTLLGRVVSVVNDEGGMVSPYARSYRWLKIVPDKELVKSINENKAWYDYKIPTTLNVPLYVREDVVTLKK